MLNSLLVMLFWSSVPFLAKYEHIGTATRLPLSFKRIASLGWFRQLRRAKLFAALWLLFAVLAFWPVASTKKHLTTWGIVAIVAVVQAVLWSGAFLKVRKVRTSLPPAP